jgi:hypothetical protein
LWTSHPTAIADILWSLFSGIVLWETSKKIINGEKDFLKETFDTAFEIFSRGDYAPLEHCAPTYVDRLMTTLNQ